MEPKKILLRYFLLFFFLSFLILNWNKISWIFYPDYLLRVVSFYLFEKRENGQQMKQNLKKEAEKTKEQTKEIGKKENLIEIPKIKISAPLILTTREKEISKALDRGVVLWPESAKFGEKGATIILGHSAPPGWPKIKYDWVFTKIDQLEKGDEIFVFFQGEKFRYVVREKIFLKKGKELPEIKSDLNILILISCWPPGKNLKRIAIVAEIL